MSDTKKKIYLGEDLVCQTFTDAEEQAKAFDLFGLEQPVVSSNAPASARPVQQGQVCEFDGVDDYISAAHLTGSETVTSSVGTSTPSISAGRIDFTAGKCSNLILSDGTQYNLNHASGTTAYDASGNGNHGTLQNGAAFVVDNTLPPEADKLNLEGYTDDSGVLKPRDESDPANDIDGNPLQYSGSVYPRRPEYRNSYAASFDGVDDYISFPLGTFNTSAWSVKAEVMLTSMTSNTDIFSQAAGTGVGRAWVRVATDGSVVTFLGGQGSTTLAPSGTIVANTRHEIKLVYTLSPNTLTLVVDGVSQTPVTRTVEESTGVFHIGVGHTASTNRLAGDVYSATLNGSIYTFGEGAGDTAHDISGNGNHGTINNASTATEGAGFWAGRIDGEENALNNKNGFSKRMLFDGVDNFVDLGASFLNVSGAEIRITAKIEVGGNPRVIVSQGGATGGWVVNTDTNNKLRIVIKQNGSTSTYRTILSSVVLSEGQIYDIDVKFTEDTATVIINGVEDASVNIGSPVGVYGDSVSSVFIGARGDNSLWWEGLIFDCSLYLDDVLLSSYNGYGNTDADWTDQSGNGNDGTVNGSPALLRIPADTSDPTLDVFGDTLTNPAITDGYNGAETELDAYNIAEGDNPSPATNNNPDLDAIEFGTDFASNDAAYMRLKSSTENDRLITFEDDLTGGDETLAQKYTQ